nr:hypothetical protein [Tanacetum cinerariifolium]
MTLSIMNEKFLSMVESYKEKAKLMNLRRERQRGWNLVILEDLKNKYRKGDKGEGKVDDLQNKVERLKGDLARAEKGKAKLMVSEKGKAKVDALDDVDRVDTLDLENRIKKLSEDFNSDEGFFGDEDVALFNDFKYPLSDAEIMMFKERPTTSRALTASIRSRAPTASTSTRSRAPIASIRSKAPIASTSNKLLKYPVMKKIIVMKRDPQHQELSLLPQDQELPLLLLPQDPELPLLP